MATHATKPEEWAGYRRHTTARTTATLVVLVEGAEANLDTDGGRWSLVCDPHGGCVAFDRQADARWYLHHPELWCPYCMEPDPDPTEPDPDREEPTMPRYDQPCTVCRSQPPDLDERVCRHCGHLIYQTTHLRGHDGPVEPYWNLVYREWDDTSLCWGDLNHPLASPIAHEPEEPEPAEVAGRKQSRCRVPGCDAPVGEHGACDSHAAILAQSGRVVGRWPNDW